MQSMAPNRCNIRQGKLRARTRSWKVLGSRFELPKKFEIIKLDGSGVYKVVVAAKDSTIEDELANLKLMCRTEPYAKRWIP